MTIEVGSTKKRKRRKKTELSLLKKALEEKQKKVVIKEYGNDCYTCPQKNLSGVNQQLGHVPWPRSALSQRCIYDKRYTRIQCFHCNINCGGMGAVALERMKSEGIDTDSMWALNIETKGKTLPKAWYLEKITEYEGLL